MNRCKRCEKSFSRRDALMRHLRLHEQPPKPQKRSCQQCRRSKIKCSGDQTQCTACERRQLCCTYSCHPDLRASRSEESEIPGILTSIPSLSPTGSMALKENSLPEDGLEVQESQHRSVAHEFALMDVAREMRDNPASSDVRTPDTNWLPPDLWGTVGETYLDWIFPNSNGHDFFGDPGFMSGSNLADYMPIVDKTAQEPAAKYDSRSRPGDAWPLQWMGSSNQPLEIPAISQLQNLSNRGSFYQIEPLTECGQRSMQNIIRGYLERSPWNTVSLANFPTNEQLDYCIDIFFARFNPAITFIHRPTFNPSKEPVVLILAIASIGACFTNIQGVLSFANSISELNRRLLLIMGEQDASTTRTESFIAAQLLQGIQGYCSSDRGLFDLSETYRGSLVHKARNAGFFRDPETEDLGLNPARGDKQWKAWITSERRRRLGWAVYEYDASVSYLYNKRPSVTVGEMMLSLPCDISLWEANSFQAWIALCPRTPDSQSLSFRMTIRSPFEENQEADSNIDNQHKHLITVTLIRFLWSLKEIQGSPIIDLVPNLWPIVEHKRMMLGKLDEYIQSPFAVQDTEIDRNVRILVQRVQLIHLSHLYGAADLMDWLPALIRSVGEHRAATERMICWGAEDPLRLREVAYHAAQILSITRHFPYNLTCEPFNVFYAGAALWCIARLLHKSSADATETAETLYIDRPPRGGEHELDKMNSWIYGRKNFNPAIYGVPSLCSLSGRVHALEQTLQILDNMRTWGIARNFVNVILKLLNVEKAQINL